MAIIASYEELMFQELLTLGLRGWTNVSSNDLMVGYDQVR